MKLIEVPRASFRRPPASALSAFPFKGVREGMSVLKPWQPQCLQTLKPVATDTGTTLDGRGNLPCPRSGNLAADPGFFGDPTNSLGSQAVYAVRSRGSSQILATSPLPLLPPSGKKTCAQAGSVRSRCWQHSHAEDCPPPPRRLGSSLCA